MDRLMRELAGKPMLVQHAPAKVDPLPKHAQDAARALRAQARALRRSIIPTSTIAICGICSPIDPEYAGNMTAARFVARVRKEVRRMVASFTDSISTRSISCSRTIIERCRELNLRLTDAEEHDQDRLHGLSHGADDELPAQRSIGSR